MFQPCEEKEQEKKPIENYNLLAVLWLFPSNQLASYLSTLYTLSAGNEQLETLTMKYSLYKI